MTDSTRCRDNTCQQRDACSLYIAEIATGQRSAGTLRQGWEWPGELCERSEKTVNIADSSSNKMRIPS